MRLVIIEIVLLSKGFSWNLWNPPLYTLVTPLFIYKTRETIKEKGGLDKRVIMLASSVSWLDISVFFSAVILTERK